MTVETLRFADEMIAVERNMVGISLIPRIDLDDVDAVYGQAYLGSISGWVRLV